MMEEIASNLEVIRGRIRAACLRAARDPSSVELVAVSKTFPFQSIRDALEAAQLIFGESRLQEAEGKIGTLPAQLQWHFIGRVQRNKLRKILPLFQMIHAIDSLKLAVYANDLAKEIGLYPKVFLQVNQAGEASKGGFSETDLESTLEEILGLSHLEVVGLMTIPPACKKPAEAGKWFRALREFRDTLEEKFSVKLPCLSMGMSDDFETAIEEGATHVRVGSAIFGKRSARVEGELG